MADIALPQTPEPRQGFRVGDIVHVYMGTSAGIRLCLCLCLFSLGLFFVLAHPHPNPNPNPSSYKATDAHIRPSHRQGPLKHG